MNKTDKKNKAAHSKKGKRLPKQVEPKKGIPPKKSRKSRPRLKPKVKLKAKKIKLKKIVIRKKGIKKRAAKKVTKPLEEEPLPEDLKWLEDDPHDNILSRFIVDGKGAQIGESIGVEGGQLIIKHRKKFYSVPLKSVREKKDTLQIRSKINWIKAERKGEAWRKRALDVIKTKKPR